MIYQFFLRITKFEMIVKLIPWFVITIVVIGLYLLHDKYFVQVMALAGNLVNKEIPKIEVDNVILQAYHPNGKLRFKLFGTKALIDEKEKTTRIEPVNLLIYDQEVEYLQEIAILAQKGSYIDAKPDYFKLAGNVECNLAVGYEENGIGKKVEEVRYIRKVFTQKLLYYPALNQFVSPGPFKIVDTKNNTVMTGQSFTYKGNEKLGEIHGPMRTVIGENPQLVLDQMNKEFFDE